ncbi:MAG: hypothetical protein FJ137_16815, partial [Deltaproteobacteria bacterium]|nr:hypothetical protein [Deltaproteobacteria bacterium]
MAGAAALAARGARAERPRRRRRRGRAWPRGRRRRGGAVGAPATARGAPAAGRRGGRDDRRDAVGPVNDDRPRGRQATRVGTRGLDVRPEGRREGRREGPDARSRELLAESVRRLRSMALIHQHLYGSVSLARIALIIYATNLAEALRMTLSPQTRLNFDLDDERVVELA